MNDITITVREEEVPAIGLGTWLLRGNSCINTVKSAVSLGYRLIDTAQDYDNEREVGEGIQRAEALRNNIFLITKLNPANFAYKDTIGTTKESCHKLSVDYIDLILLHWPNTEIPLEETLNALAQLQKEGLIKHIGLSNFPPSLVDEAIKYTEIFCNQVEFHPYLVRQNLLDHAIMNDYLLMAYSPVAKGRLMEDSFLRSIAREHGKSPAQVSLRWLVQEGIVPVAKASNLEHLEENIDIFDFSLSDEEMAAIRALDRGLHLDPVSDMADEE
ncbi:MAG: aldo/keto reductase [Bacteroidales bacterium]|nr:aldo/keto reductase [Bacteroidales bacterium]